MGYYRQVSLPTTYYKPIFVHKDIHKTPTQTDCFDNTLARSHSLSWLMIFGVKYNSSADLEHLLATIKTKYTTTVENL